MPTTKPFHRVYHVGNSNFFLFARTNSSIFLEYVKLPHFNITQQLPSSLPTLRFRVYGINRNLV